MLLLGVIAASLAGIASAVAVTQSLERYASSLLDDRRFAALSPRKIDPLPGTYEEALSAVRNAQSRSLVFFVDASAEKAFAPAIMKGDEVISGSGLIISADGWVLTTKENLTDYLVGASAYEGMRVAYDGELFEVEKVVSDTMTEAVALKVKNVNGWPTIGIGASGDLLPGASVFGIGANKRIQASSIVASMVDEEIAPAEIFAEHWSIEDALAAGMPLLGSSGDAVGFMDGEGEAALPLYTMQPFIRQTLRGAPIVHAGLGVTVLDLSRFSTLDNDWRQGLSTGALIAPVATKLSALVEGGPADNAGLAINDVILAIDDVEVTDATSLAEILVTYAPDQRVNLLVMQDGEEREVTVTLGTAEELVY